MTFRCGCQGVVSLPQAKAGEEAGSRCRSCGRWFELSSLSGPPESTSGGLVIEARRLAFSSGIDLPAAYSVTLGIMTLEDVRKRLPQPKPSKKRREKSGTEEATGAKPSPWRIVLPLLLLLTGGALWQLGRAPSAAHTVAAPGRSMVGSAEVLTDQRGRVVQVSAPDPRSVVAAYCKAVRAEGHYELVDIVPSPLRPAGERFGLLRLRDPAGAGTMLALTIAEDRTTQRWVAGNGLVPLEPSAAPSWAAQAGRP